MELSRWNRLVFGQILKKIQEKRKVLCNMVQRDRDRCMGREINELRREINDLLDKEEIMWQQRSRVQWLGLGDRYTKYFHSKSSERRKKNTIFGLRDENGIWSDNIESIAVVAVSYFEKLYTTSLPSCISEVTDTIPTRVTNKMNRTLIKEFTKEEVMAALQQMHPTKAPDPTNHRWLVVIGSNLNLTLRLLFCLNNNNQ